MSTPTPLPSITDPVVVNTSDGTLFVCWVEFARDRKPTKDRFARWIFVATDRTVYRGPVYDGQTMQSEIVELVDSWWTTKKALGQRGVTPEKMRQWLKVGR